MLYIMLLLSVCCVFGGYGLRNIGTTVANITFISNGVPMEIPQELVEYGQRNVNAGTVILVVGVVGLLCTIFFFYKEAE